MAHRRAWLVKRVKADGVWTTGTPIFSKFGSLTRKVRVRGVNRQLDGVYVLESYDANGRRQRRTLGSNEGAAERELKHMQRKLADAADGHPVTFEIKSTKHPLELTSEPPASGQYRRYRSDAARFPHKTLASTSTARSRRVQASTSPLAQRLYPPSEAGRYRVSGLETSVAASALLLRRFLECEI